MKLNRFLIIVIMLGVAALQGCEEETPPGPSPTYPDVTRAEKLPTDITKRGPETDPHPPILHSSDFAQPVPMPGPVNTSGAEDSPFILPDGNTMYFFFTPDVRVAVEDQLFDDVTGVWVSRKTGDVWDEPERVWLNDPGILSLDGAVSIQDDEMWFASAREGFTGVNMFTAEWLDDRWGNWQYSGDRLMQEIQIGEVHLHGDDLYFHSGRDGGFGGYDIWMTTRTGADWSDPVNIEAVNSVEMDGYPFVSSDGNELWFTRTYLGTPAVFRSLKVDSEWSEPEMIVSQFAGEPTLDDAGNLYFVHHYFENDVMIEADIYIALKQ
jgi:hypothetical protein